MLSSVLTLIWLRSLLVSSGWDAALMTAIFQVPAVVGCIMQLQPIRLILKFFHNYTITT